MIRRALIVGLGSIGQRHLRLLCTALPDADIRVLRHSGCAGPVKFAGGCFDRLEAAVEFAPQLAIIASPAPFHLQTAMTLAETGAHLLVEKPISDGISGVADLIELCAKRGLQLQVGYNLRFLKTLQVFRAEIERGRIGAVRAVRCEIGQYLPDWREGVDYRTTVSAKAALGGGVLLELSHELDMLRWVFGEPIWVSAWMGRQSGLEVDVEDCVMLQMGLSTGSVAQVAMDFIRRDTTRICTAIGESGSLRWDAVSGTVMHFEPASAAWTEVLIDKADRDVSYACQIDALLAASETGRPDRNAAQGVDGLSVLRIIAAAHLSDTAKGRRVALSDVREQ